MAATTFRDRTQETLAGHRYPADVLKDLAVALIAVALPAGVLVAGLRPLPGVWRGEITWVDPPRFGPIPARTYPAFMLWVGAWFFGVFLMCVTALIAVVADAPRGNGIVLAPAMAGAFFILAAIPLILVHMCVALFARPRFLVPPPCRDQPGGIARLRQRRREGQLSGSRAAS
jgi:hypothetical protein